MIRRRGFKRLLNRGQGGISWESMVSRGGRPCPHRHPQLTRYPLCTITLSFLCFHVSNGIELLRLRSHRERRRFLRLLDMEGRFIKRIKRLGWSRLCAGRSDGKCSVPRGKRDQTCLWRWVVVLLRRLGRGIVGCLLGNDTIWKPHVSMIYIRKT